MLNIGEMEENKIIVASLIKQTLESECLSADQKVIIITELAKALKTEEVPQPWTYPVYVPNPWPAYPSFPVQPYYITTSGGTSNPTPHIGLTTNETPIAV